MATKLMGIAIDAVDDPDMMVLGYQIIITGRKKAQLVLVIGLTYCFRLIMKVTILRSELKKKETAIIDSLFTYKDVSWE